MNLALLMALVIEILDVTGEFSQYKCFGSIQYVEKPPGLTRGRASPFQLAE